jgi:4-hydroxybenzoate polyprenyltransferase
MTSKIKALLATGRISNLPTVWCNCVVAVVLLIGHHAPFKQNLHQLSSEYPVLPIGAFFLVFITLIICSSLLYVGGCFLGDAIDSDFDKKHKPDRPIPSGLLSKKIIFFASWVMLITGLLLPIVFHIIPNPIGSYLTDPKTANYSWQQMTAVPFLFSAIVLYSVFHKRYPIVGLPLIGLCRFFLVIFATSIAACLTITYHLSNTKVETSITTPYLILPIILYASAVCIYTIAFASVARTESSDSPITWRNILRYTMLALPLTILFTNQSLQIETITALIIYAIWLSYAFSFLSKNKGAYVSKCLAGFCLLDACFVAQFGWVWVIICLILFLLALALQKIAPAT